MNKGELVSAVAQTTGVTKKEVDIIVSATLDKIVDIVATGGKVTLVGFGSFEPRDRKSRDGRNPKRERKLRSLPRQYRHLLQVKRSKKEFHLPNRDSESISIVSISTHCQSCSSVGLANCVLRRSMTQQLRL